MSNRLETIIRGVHEYLRPPPIVTAGELRLFLGREAAHLAQYSAKEFTRNTLGYFGQSAWHHPVFQARVEISRWESYAAVLADVVIVAEGHLRPHVAAPAVDAITAALATMFDSLLAEHPMPKHRPEGWGPESNALRVRLAQARLHPPTPVGELARQSARRAFEVLPIYSGENEIDYKTIENAIRFGMIGMNDRLTKRLDAARVAAELCA